MYVLSSRGGSLQDKAGFKLCFAEKHSLKMQEKHFVEDWLPAAFKSSLCSTT